MYMYEKVFGKSIIDHLFFHLFFFLPELLLHLLDVHVLGNQTFLQSFYFLLFLKQRTIQLCYLFFEMGFLWIRYSLLVWIILWPCSRLANTCHSWSAIYIVTAYNTIFFLYWQCRIPLHPVQDASPGQKETMSDDPQFKTQKCNIICLV